MTRIPPPGPLISVEPPIINPTPRKAMFAAQDRRLRVWAPGCVPSPELVGHTTGRHRIAPCRSRFRRIRIPLPRRVQRTARWGLSA